MIRWHHRLNGQQALGDGDGKGSLACCSPWGLQRVGHNWATEQQQQIIVTECWNCQWIENMTIFSWFLKRRQPSTGCCFFPQKCILLGQNTEGTTDLRNQHKNTGKTIALTRKIFVGKVMSLLFNMLSRLVVAFLPGRKHLLISWLQSPSAVILELSKRKCHCFHCFPVYLPWDAMIFVFWMLSFKPAFSLWSFTFIKQLFSSSSLSAIGWCHLHRWGYWYFSWQSWFQLVFHPAWHFTW